MIVCFFTSTFSWAQDRNVSSESTQRSPVTVSKVGRGIEPPTLSATDFSPVISTNCERKLSGKTALSLIVDSTGKAQNIGFIKPATTDIDRLAVVIAQMDRFTPARQGDKAIVTAEALELQLQGCVVSTADNQGRKMNRMLLASPPEQVLRPVNIFPSEVIFATQTIPANMGRGVDSQKYRVGGSIAAPKPINAPEAEYPPQGKVKSGECLITVLVDVFGLPQDLIVVRPLEPSMDQKALEAVNRYRFKPAMRDGLEPVPVRVSIAVYFR
jgi:TonB family protein